MNNEYVITRQLSDIPCVRPVNAKEGSESRPVLLLEYIQGQSLSELIQEESLDLHQKLQLAVNIAGILSRIHERKVMHKDITLKLLAKNAENRYQSARGLQADLQRCLAQLQSTDQLEPFELGHDDFIGRLQIHQKLYGRQTEIDQLKIPAQRFDLNAVSEMSDEYLVRLSNEE